MDSLERSSADITTLDDYEASRPQGFAMQIVDTALDDILKRVLEKLVTGKRKVNASRGSNSEIVGVSICLRNPRARLSHTEKKGKIFSAIGELLWYHAKTDKLRFIEYYLPEYGLQNSKDGKTIPGAYGPRLFNLRGINQVENALKLLRERPHSRRAVIQLFDAEDIDQNLIEIPCTCTLQLLLRDKKLDLLVYMRSNDAFLGFSHDVFAFTMLQEVFARSLGVELGKYYHFVGSMHLYDKHRDKARQYVDEGWQSTQNIQMPAMPIGDPWQSIDVLLKIESRLRRGRNVDLADYKLDPYWEDLARLLQVFRASKEQNRSQITRIRKQMISPVFDEYIEQRKTSTTRTIKASRQRLLFSSPSFARTVIPSWMNGITKALVETRTETRDIEHQIIPWSSPVPFFGDIINSRVATLAVNPSNLEFADQNGIELTEADRRLETLSSLRIPNWSAAKHKHYKRVNQAAIHYFDVNPYKSWFKPLENILLNVDCSYYGSKKNIASHLDLVPFATTTKWSKLSSAQRSELLLNFRNTLADLLAESPIEVLVLNGVTAVRCLGEITGVIFRKRRMKKWDLPRKNGTDVPGHSFQGEINAVGDVMLRKNISVYGYNHNLQSSYGISKSVQASIGEWLTRKLNGVLNAKK